MPREPTTDVDFRNADDVHDTDAIFCVASEIAEIIKIDGRLGME